MAILKCKSCGGELQKNDSVYICGNCGETYSSAEINDVIEKSEAMAENLLMEITGVFAIAGRGIVITGTVEQIVQTGDTVLINGTTYVIGQIESNRKLMAFATPGTPVGLLLQNAEIDNLKVGFDVLIASARQNVNSPEAIARQLLNEGYSKMDATKMLRERTGLNLSESKSIIDYIFDPNGNNSDKSAKDQRTGGCYIATCVYGSYDCPQVWTLRRFRDNTLRTTWYGRAFIHVYYAVSPVFVKLFGKRSWFKHICKPILDKFVMCLNKKGCSDQRYSDR